MYKATYIAPEISVYKLHMFSMGLNVIMHATFMYCEAFSVHVHVRAVVSGEPKDLVVHLTLIYVCE